MRPLTLTLGIRPWLSTLVSFLLLASLPVNRNPLVFQGGDNLLLLLLFWGLFLPWGARLSLAAAVQRPSREDVPDQSPTHLSIASKALIFQVLAVYFFFGVLETATPGGWMARRSTTRFPIINLQPTWPLLGRLARSNGAAQSLRLVA